MRVVYYICDVCGTNFDDLKYNRGQSHFCSRECLDKDIANEMKQEEELLRLMENE